MQLFVNGKMLDNCKGLLAVLRKKNIAYCLALETA